MRQILTKLRQRRSVRHLDTLSCFASKEGGLELPQAMALRNCYYAYIRLLLSTNEAW